MEKYNKSSRGPKEQHCNGTGGDYPSRRLLLPGRDTNFSYAYEAEEPQVSVVDDQQQNRGHRRRNHRESCLIVAVILLVLLSLLLSALLLVHYFPQPVLRPFLSVHLFNKANDACVSEQCVRAASRILDAINSSADPCEDFFEFACGNWVKTHSIPDDDYEVAIFKDLGKEVLRALRDLLENEKDFPSSSVAAAKARSFYKLCTNETEISSTWKDVFREKVLELGGWPMFSSSQSLPELAWKGLNIETTFGRLVAHYSQSSLFQLTVEPDEKNTDVYVIMIDQPTFFLGNRIFYIMPETEKLRESYRLFMIELAKELGVSSEVAERHMTRVLMFEKRLAEIHVPEEERFNVSAQYSRHTLRELSRRFPYFSWKTFIEVLYPRTTGLVSMDTEVVVFAMDYLERFNEVIKSYSADNIVDYMLWRWFAGESDQRLDGFLREVPGRISDLFSEYKFNSSGITIPRSRQWKRCTEVTNFLFPMATGLLYVNHYFDPVARKDAQNMIRNLKLSFRDMLEDENWIESETREKAKRKAEGMRIKIGYPDMLEDSALVDAYYKDYEIVAGDYFATKLSALWQIGQKNLARVHKQVDVDEWFTGPAVVNGFYQPTLNEIVFPAAILQSMFYHKHNPKSLNYGGIGVVIGHEISHGFDDRGRQYDQKGNIVEWWDNESLKRFEKKAQCIEDQYSSFTFWGKHINGKLTKGENIADNGGLKQSFRAYKTWVQQNGEERPLPGLSYSHDQLFFISYAQIWCARVNEKSAMRKLSSIHAPGPVRVRGPLANSAEFAQAFKCKDNSPMNPPAHKKCSLW